MANSGAYAAEAVLAAVRDALLNFVAPATWEVRTGAAPGAKNTATGTRIGWIPHSGVTQNAAPVFLSLSGIAGGEAALASGVPGYLRFLLEGSGGATRLEVSVGSALVSKANVSAGDLLNLNSAEVWPGELGMPSTFTASAAALNAAVTSLVETMGYLTLLTGSAPGPDSVPTGTEVGAIVLGHGSASNGEVVFSATPISPVSVGTIGYARLHDGNPPYLGVDLSVGLPGSGADVILSRLTATQAEIDAGTDVNFLAQTRIRLSPANDSVAGAVTLPFPTLKSGALAMWNLHCGAAGQHAPRYGQQHVLAIGEGPAAAPSFRRRPSSLARVTPRQHGLFALDRGVGAAQWLATTSFFGVAASYVAGASGFVPVIPRVWDGTSWQVRLPLSAR